MDTTIDNASDAATEAPAPSGIERRRHPRVSAEPTTDNDRREGDRRQSERRADDRRQGDRRQGDRRSMESLREIRTSVAPDRRGKGVPGFRLGMKPARIALLAVAIASGGLAAFLTSRGADPEPLVATAQPAQLIQEPRARILVASTAIGMGERLNSKSVAWEEWPESALRPDYINSTDTPDALQEMSGTIARFEILPGEPIREQKLALGKQGYLSAVLESGMRGVSVSVTAASASGGFIVPNDHVDVILVEETDLGLSSKTILRNVRVLAINSRIGETGGTGGDEDPDDLESTTSQRFTKEAIATLELDGHQSEIVAGASAAGRLSLAVLSIDDFSAPAQPGHEGANAAIRINSPFWHD